jgi:glycosyltransferase involved in cell wall biosynthesis
MPNKKILALTKYSRKGPSSRYRYYNYINCFQQNNIEMTVSPFFKDKYFDETNKIKKLINILFSYTSRFWVVLKLFFGKKYSLIIIEYEIFPYFPSTFEKLLKYKKLPYIVDYDDAIFHQYDRHANSLIKILFKNKIAKVMKLAETVIVGNAYLKDYTINHNKNIVMLPTVAFLEKYASSYENYTKTNVKITNKNPFIIGWIGSKSTSKYLLEIIPAIQQFVSQFNVVCHLIGFDKSLLTEEQIKNCKITIIDWHEETEILEILKFDIGIMPLTDDYWSRGKCGFKLIQYMSCKKPVIASPVGINNILVENKINGFLAENNGEWLDSFKILHSNKSLRESMSENNWKKIKKSYNNKINCHEYVTLLNRVLSLDKIESQK